MIFLALAASELVLDGTNHMKLLCISYSMNYLELCRPNQNVFNFEML